MIKLKVSFMVTLKVKNKQQQNIIYFTGTSRSYI